MSTPRSNDAMRLLEDLRRRHDALRTQKIRNQSEHERAERELGEAEAKAVEQFGTSDENQLMAMVEEIRGRNAQALQDFSTQITAIEAELSALEQSN